MKYLKAREVHGDSYTSLYSVWTSMRNRCSLPSDTNYQRYGAVGISVCPDWQKSYLLFRAWARANGYQPGTLDRINGTGNYEPSNCRWVTSKQQNRNIRTNHMITAFGITAPASQWAEDPRCTVSYNALLYRLRRGWSPEAAIATPRTQKGGPR